MIKRNYQTAILIVFLITIVISNSLNAFVQGATVDYWCGYSINNNGSLTAVANDTTVDDWSWVGAKCGISESRLQHVGYNNTHGISSTSPTGWGAGNFWDVDMNEQIKDNGWGAHLYTNGGLLPKIYGVLISNERVDDGNPYPSTATDTCTITVQPGSGYADDWDISSEYRESASLEITNDTGTYYDTVPDLGEYSSTANVIIYSYEGNAENYILFNMTYYRSGTGEFTGNISIILDAS